MKYAIFVMRRIFYVGLALIALVSAIVVGVNADTVLTWQYREEGEALSGGMATVFDTTPNAFGHPAPGLPREEELFFFVGNSFFNQNWVSSPSSTTARDGLGPLFNSRSCAGCHFKDGRGRAPATDDERGRAPATDDERGTGLLLRVTLPDGSVPPHMGIQLQDQAIQGLTPEGRIQIRYDTLTGQYADGTAYTLRVPTYTIADPANALPNDIRLSPRVGNQVMGLGLLEAVPETTLLALADPEDVNGDGISGRPNYVLDVQSGELALGRFGWKANQPNLLQQTAAAFNGDIGITTSLFPVQNCTSVQSECLNAPNGGSPEIDDEDLGKVLLYVSTLSVPARRDWNNPEVLRGKGLFTEANCAACHIPILQTGEHPSVPALANQTIRPYTDLLLHDMGEALGDDAPDGEATGTEWRTPPLWGVGLFETVNKHTTYLHDGRARNLEEAILWHGGEAEAAKQAFIQMSGDERQALIAFLKSL
jgi:CxxC motif-containing protein (DUF1111 family)